MKQDPDAHLLSGAYALHSVTGEEAAEVEAAMATSEELRGEVAELTDTAVLLGLSVEPEDPPPALRTRLLDLIEQTPQQSVGEAPETEPAEAVPATVPPGNHLAGRRPRRRPAVLLALAAVAVLLFGGGLLVDRLVQPNSAQSQNTAFARLTSAADVQRAQAPVSGGGTVTVYWSASLDESGVVLNGVDRPAGKALQMWRVTGSIPVSAGLYAPPHGQHYAVMKGALRPNERLAVTVEPPGGSAKPTTKPIVVVANA